MVLAVADDVLGSLVEIPDSKGVMVKCQDATKGLAKLGKSRSVRLDSRR